MSFWSESFRDLVTQTLKEAETSLDRLVGIEPGKERSSGPAGTSPAPLLVPIADKKNTDEVLILDPALDGSAIVHVEHTNGYSPALHKATPTTMTTSVGQDVAPPLLSPPKYDVSSSQEQTDDADDSPLVSWAPTLLNSLLKSVEKSNVNMNSSNSTPRTPRTPYKYDHESNHDIWKSTANALESSPIASGNLEQRTEAARELTAPPTPLVHDVSAHQSLPNGDNINSKRHEQSMTTTFANIIPENKQLDENVANGEPANVLPASIPPNAVQASIVTPNVLEEHSVVEEAKTFVIVPPDLANVEVHENSVFSHNVVNHLPPRTAVTVLEESFSSSSSLIDANHDMASQASIQMSPSDVDSQSTSTAITDTTISQLTSQLAKVQALLDERERQLSERSAVTASLHFDNQTLRDQLQLFTSANLQPTSPTEMASGTFQEAGTSETNLDLLKREFSERLAKMERKHKHICQERDALKKQLASAPDIGSKDAEIAQLKAALEEQANTSRMQVATLQEVERTHAQTIESMKQLSGVTSKQTEELQTTARDKTAQCIQLQTALDAAWADLASAQRKHALEVRSAQSERAAAEKAKEAEFHQLLRQQAIAEHQKEVVYVQQVQELREALQASSHSTGDKEEEYLDRIRLLQEQLEAAETRNQQATQAGTETTSPLLREISDLQAQLAHKHATFTQVEQLLRSRLSEQETRSRSDQQALREAQETSSQIKQQLGDLQADYTSSMTRQQQLVEMLQASEKTCKQLQLTVGSLESQKRDIESDLERWKLQAQTITHSFEQARIDSSKMEAALQAQIQALNQKIHRMTSISDNMSFSTPTGTPKSSSAYAAQHYGYSLAPSASSSNSPLPSPSISRSPSDMSLPESTASPFASRRPTTATTTTSDNLVSSSSALQSPNGAGGGAGMLHPPLYGLSASASALVEMLQSAVTQRDAEIEALKANLDHISREKSHVEAELLQTSQTLLKHDAELKRLAGIQEQKKELEARYMASLEMLGERSEKVAEINEDISELRTMYKTQINDLCVQLEQLQNDKKLLEKKLSTMKSS